MKIAFVNQPIDAMIPPNQNSIGLWTYHVAPHLAKDHSVTVFAKKNKMQKSWNDPSGAKYDFVTSLPNRLTQRIVEKLEPSKDPRNPVVASQWYSLDYISIIAMATRLGNFDVVHVHNFTQFVPVLRAIHPKAKIVLHMNGEWLSSLDYQKMKARAEKADLILGSSDHITNLVCKRFPHLSERCQTVYNGVKADMFLNPDGNGAASQSSEKRILFVGRVSPEKGVHVLIEAFQRVAAQMPDVHLDLVGPIGAMPIEFIVSVSDDVHVANLAKYYTEDYGIILQKLVPPALADRVHFVGPVPQAQLSSYYQNTDVLVNPSFSESFGMSLVEAMATEKPVVATRVGGMVEIVEEGRNGLLVNQGDPDALADAILTILRDDDLRAKMGKQGRQSVLRRFDWSQIAISLLAQYERIK